jgi:hypothetical protein
MEMIVLDTLGLHRHGHDLFGWCSDCGSLRGRPHSNSPNVGELDIDTRRAGVIHVPPLFGRYGQRQQRWPLVLDDCSRDDDLVGRRRFCSGFIGHIGRGLV